MDLIILKRVLSELEMQYKSMSTMTTGDGKVYNVDVVIKDPLGRLVGLVKAEKGAYQFIADSKGLTKDELKQQQNFINKIKQKYAYNIVVDKLKKEGYVIAEEEKVQNNTIRLVARKWS
jgi:hypothetical protein